MWYRLLRPLFAAPLRAYRRRAMLHELEALDDRMLKDIGLSRSDLPAAVDRSLNGVILPAGRLAGASPLLREARPARGGNDNRGRARTAA
jgi:uncharacterized protein YjiS (DUF1127 family)